MTVFAGLAPAVIWMAVFWWWDRHEREPLGLILKLFVIGAIPVVVLAVAGSYFADVALTSIGVSTAAMSAWVGAVVLAPVVEEPAKYLGGRFGTRKTPAFTEPVDGIVYGTAVGLGFAAAENVLFLLAATADLEAGRYVIEACVAMTAEECAVATVLPIRALGTTLMHGLAAGLAGYMLTKRKLDSVFSLPYPRLRGLMVAVLLHAGWNLGASIDFLPLSFSVLIVGAVVYRRVFKRCLAQSPALNARVHRVPPDAG